MELHNKGVIVNGPISEHFCPLTYEELTPPSSNLAEIVLIDRKSNFIVPLSCYFLISFIPFEIGSLNQLEDP
jgi:hypothetical protein